MNIQAQSCNLCGKIRNKGALSGTIKSEDSLRGKMCKPDLLVVHEVSFNVDDTFSKTSTNPLQNKVVTSRFTDLDTTIGNIDALLATI